MAKQAPPLELEAQIGLEELSKHIKAISKASKRMLSKGLTLDAIVLLVFDSLPQGSCGKRTIKRILEALPQLAERYCQ